MNPQAAIDDALKLHSAGQLPQAEAAYRTILSQHPDFPPALHLLGVALSQQGQKDLAVDYISRAIALVPAAPDFHANLALVFLEKGEPQRSIAEAQRAITLNPGHAEAQNILGNSLKQLGKIEEAVAAYQRALAIRADHPDARHNLADALVRLGRRAEADALIEQSLARNPQDLKAMVARGHALIHQKKFPDAAEAFRQVLAIKPDLPEAHDGLATSLMEQNRVDEAADLYQKAIDLNPLHPGPHSNLGFARVLQGRVDEGIACYYKALKIRPDLADTWNNLGNAQLAKLDTNASIAAYRRAIYFKPDHTDAHWNQSLLMLLLGDFENGWAEYEWRWLRFPEQKRSFPQPLWDGSEIAGKSILLHAEQGLGDTLQFVRLAGLVAELGASVNLEVQRELLPLLQKTPAMTRVLGRGDPLPPFDVHCPLMSLPYALGLKPEHIPAKVPYVLPDEALVRRFGKLLEERESEEEKGSRKLRVGLAWAGAAIHRRDRERSIPLAMLEPLARVPGVQLVSLQKGDPVRHLASLPEGMKLIDLTAQLHDFADTAALMGNLDLVVTVDTSVAHLAGAIGKQVWVMLPYSPDWRWLLGREDSPWYATMRLFRQPKAGDWPRVIGQIQRELQVAVENRRG